MRKIGLALVCVVLSLCAFAQGSFEDSKWKLYLSYQKATHCTVAGDLIYAITNGNLVSYNSETEEVRHYSSFDGLGSKGIFDISYSAQEKCLVVLYNDSHVDLIYDDGETIIGVPGLKGSSYCNSTPTDLFVGENEVIVSNAQGIGIVNLVHHNVVGFYTFDAPVISAASYDSSWWVSTEKDLFRCSTTSNPYDKNSWVIQQRMKVDKFVLMGGHLYANIHMTADTSQGTAYFGVMREQDYVFQKIADGVYTSLRANGNQIISGNSNYICQVDAQSPMQLSNAINHPNQWKDIVPLGTNRIWAAQDAEGCLEYDIKDSKFSPSGRAFTGSGPEYDHCFYTHYIGDRLLIAGGRLDPYDLVHYAPTAMIYENDKWTFFQSEGVSSITNVVYRDLSCIVQDPADPNHHFISAAGTGLYEFRDFKFVRNYTVDNSALESAVPKEVLAAQKKYVRIDGLQYDKDGNLWMINNQVDSVVRVLKPDGSWKSFYIESFKQAPTCMRTLMDSKGRYWVTSRRTVGNHNGGLLCFDFNGTVDNTKDDVAHYRTSFINQDGTSYSLQGVYDLAEDSDGSIWVATLSGVFVIDDPDSWTTSNFTVTQPKIPRNDGTNYADYLLGDAQVSAVAIDGAGQKWLGTISSGVYVTSPDGSAILHHFTTENSPLLSNQIHSISPNLITGEVMIGTENGLCSYQSQTSTPEVSLNRDNIKVYPNPVRPEHNLGVTITGLPKDADIKIVSAAGHALAGGTSAGGTFTWDCRASDGGRVGAGVYYIMISTADGKQGVAAKFVVI